MSCLFKIPITYQTPNGLRKTFVPCGRCLDCQKRVSSDWVFRLTQESTNNKYSLFLTLTYNNENLPKDSNLHYRDVQLFFHRLRHHFRFRFFCIGEYGFNGTLRPHYHIILFSNDNKINSSLNLYNQVWNKGFVSVDPLTIGRVKYVSSYSSLSDVVRHSVRPFRHMSLRPAIGFNFLHSPIFKKSLEIDRFAYRRCENGRNFYQVIPRYYQRYAKKFGYVGKSPYCDTLINYKPYGYVKINVNNLNCDDLYTKPYKNIVPNNVFFVPSEYYQRHYPDFVKLSRKKADRGDKQKLSIPYDLWLLSTLRFDKKNIALRFSSPLRYDGSFEIINPPHILTSNKLFDKPNFLQLNLNL